jgi:hypothetical protein
MNWILHLIPMVVNVATRIGDAVRRRRRERAEQEVADRRDGVDLSGDVVYINPSELRGKTNGDR